MIKADTISKARDCLMNATDNLLLAASQPRDSFYTPRRLDAAIDDIRDGLKFLNFDLVEAESVVPSDSTR